MSIAERLSEMDLTAVSSQKEAAKVEASLQTDNFAVLLVQGLESNDAEILNVKAFSSWRLSSAAEKLAYFALTCLLLEKIEIVVLLLVQVLRTVEMELMDQCLSNAVIMGI